LGGVTSATADVLTILDAMGWDVILLETVGVGQNEVEVMRQVPTVILVQNPGDGDAIQSVKAGILEVAHIFAVNKADMAGADKVARNLREMLATGGRARDRQWDVPVVLTEATTGRGTTELADAISNRQQYLVEHPDIARNQARERLRARVVELSSAALRRQLSALARAAGAVADKVELAIDRESDPYEVSADLVARIGSKVSP
jgi:LAO/AO transport system kinase